MIARSRRNGRRRHAARPGDERDEPDERDASRLPYSIHAWVSSGATTESPHFGQFGQPSPDPVSRTAAPGQHDEPERHQRIQREALGAGRGERGQPAADHGPEG
jgi:hypothetical protein